MLQFKEYKIRSQFQTSARYFFNIFEKRDFSVKYVPRASSGLPVYTKEYYKDASVFFEYVFEFFFYGKRNCSSIFDKNLKNPDDNFNILRKKTTLTE